MSQLLFFWFPKCTLFRYFSKQIVGLWVFLNAYQSRNSFIFIKLYHCTIVLLFFWFHSTDYKVLFQTQIISMRPFHDIYQSWNSNILKSNYSSHRRRVWKYQRGNQNPYIEEQTTHWLKEKVQKDKKRSTKHTHKTKGRVTRTLLKTGVNSGASEGFSVPAPIVAPVEIRSRMKYLHLSSFCGKCGFIGSVC